MDTALTTGMFTTSFLSNQVMKKDVSVSKKDGFENFFNESLNKRKVENESIRTEKDVNEQDNNKIEDKSNVKKDEKTEDVNENKDVEKSEIKDKLKKKKEIDKTKDVENVPDETLKKLDELLEKLDVEPSEMLENIDVSESVDEVGPQLVETEKITLNLKDEESKDLEVLEEVENLGENESDFSEYMDENFNKGMSNDKENSKDDKLKIKDFRTKIDNTNIADFDNEGKFKIEDVNFRQDGILNNGIVNNMTSMQEKIDVLKQVTEQMDVSLFDDKSEMVMKLKPDDLGKVTVKLSLENGIISAKFLAESEKVKEILESNFNQLKESLKEQGMVIQEFSVSVDSGNSEERTFYQKKNRMFNKKDDKIDTSFNYNDVNYYDYGEADVNNYWPDSTISFSA